MALKHLFTALRSDGSGDYVMAIRGNSKLIERAVQDMPSVRHVIFREKDITEVVFKGRVYEPMGMFNIIRSRAKSS